MYSASEMEVSENGNPSKNESRENLETYRIKLTNPDYCYRS